jgi:preprotein translocase subunit SecE
MSANTRTQQVKLNLFKKITSFLLLIVAVLGNYFYRDTATSPRTIITLVLIVLAIFIFCPLTKRKMMIKLFREAVIEMRKVIWPTRQETVYTTLVVAVVTAVISLILWGLDGIFFRLVSSITDLRFF